MSATSKTRTLVCILLALPLCAPMLATAAPAAADRNSATELRSLATLTSTVLLARSGASHDHAGQRPSAPSLFTLIPVPTGGSDPCRLAAAVERRLPDSLWTGAPPTGRSPPAIS